MERPYAVALVLVVGLSWTLQLAVAGTIQPGEWTNALHPFSTTVSVLVLVTFAFEHWAWRWLPAGPRKRPLLAGVWRAELRSQWIDPQTGMAAGNIRAFFVVRQTYSRLTIRMITPRSRSESVATSLSRADDGVFRLYSMYRNEPRIEDREKSPIHYGALVLDIPSGDLTTFEGHYWTDRKSFGAVVALERRDGDPNSFADAESLFAGGG